MQKLEKILEEIEHQERICLEIDNSDEFNAGALDMAISIKEIIRKRMNDGWIPVEKKLPPNAKYKGALCPMYQLDTKYGVTEGWYNPDLESWFVLVWFMTERYVESDIDFERGSYPKIVRCENKVNDKNSIVTAWRPLPDPYRPERSEGE